MTPTKSILHHETVVLSNYSQTVSNPCIHNRNPNLFNKVIQFYCISSVTNLHANFRAPCKTVDVSGCNKISCEADNHSPKPLKDLYPSLCKCNCYIKNGEKKKKKSTTMRTHLQLQLRLFKNAIDVAAIAPARSHNQQNVHFLVLQINDRQN